MNSTPNYGLSQIEASDKPTWLQMYNSDMLKIDTGMEENKTAAAGNGTKINQIETNLEQVTQTVQNQGTTLQEYGSTLTQHTTLIGQNSQNIGKLQGSVDELVQLVDERDNDIWVFIAGTDGIGVKDGTWKTSWIGYAMEYINRPDTRVVVLTNQGAGMVQAGLSGQNFLGMLQNANITNKNLVTKIFIGSNNADNLGITNYNTYWLNFMSYCRSNFPNAKVEFLGYWYNFTASTYDNYVNFISNIQTTGIYYNSTFGNHVYRRSWFNPNYTDNAQHIIGSKIANYLLSNTFDSSMISQQMRINEILTPSSNVTLESGSATIKEMGNHVYSQIDLYINLLNLTGTVLTINLGEIIAEGWSNKFNQDVIILDSNEKTGIGKLLVTMNNNVPTLTLRTIERNLLKNGLYAIEDMGNFIMLQ